MKKHLIYDYSFMLSDAVGGHGILDEELNKLKERLLTLRKDCFSGTTKLGFMQLPYDMDTLNDVTKKSEEYKRKFKTLIVLGIGGSDLGARAAIAALRHPYANFVNSDEGMQVFFLGGNTDPMEIQNVVDVIDWKDTAINVISKSGDTVETMSTFVYLRDLLVKAVGKEQHSRHIIATTDKKSGTLRAIVEREGYDSLVVPDNVGGRFSVLSTVGLFPIACAGVAINELLSGARDLAEKYTQLSGELMGAELFAIFHFLGFAEKKQNIHVLIPYSSALKEFGFWFRQLWAESLGKRFNTDNVEVYTGPTPVAALGATDQHSQFQLYYHGPFDKLFTFIEVENHKCNISVPDYAPDIEGVSYMNGLSFGKIINTELTGSSLALAERGRPNGRVVIPELSPYYLGQLFQFFEIATAYEGALLGVNTYDQPAVELGKHNVYALLHRKGFEKRETELENWMKKYNKRIV